MKPNEAEIKTGIICPRCKWDDVRVFPQVWGREYVCPRCIKRWVEVDKAWTGEEEESHDDGK